MVQLIILMWCWLHKVMHEIIIASQKVLQSLTNQDCWSLQQGPSCNTCNSEEFGVHLEKMQVLCLLRKKAYRSQSQHRQELLHRWGKKKSGPMWQPGQMFTKLWFSSGAQGQPTFLSNPFRQVWPRDCILTNGMWGTCFAPSIRRWSSVSCPIQGDALRNAEYKLQGI